MKDFNSERNLLPSKAQKIDGPGRVKLSQLVSGKMQVQRAESNDKPTIAKIRMQSGKKVVGITLEMTHGVSIWKPQWQDSQQLESRYQGRIEVGRKYYIGEKSLRTKASGTGSEFNFDIPKEVIQQKVTGPKVRKRISWFYDFTENLRAPSLIDSLHRDLNGVWVHYQDGTVEKIAKESLPEPFTLLSVQEETREQNRIQERVRRLVGDYEEPKPALPLCKSLF